MKHTYHYCIELSYYMWDRPRVYDGFLSLEHRIKSDEDFQQVKQDVIALHHPGISNSVIAVIKSLSYLGAVEE